MPIDVSWYIPERVVHIHIFDDVPFDLLPMLAEQVSDYIQTGEPPVHFLLDDNAGIDPPPINIKSLSNLFKVRIEDSYRVGWVMGIGEPHAIAKIVVPLFMNVLQVKFMRVDTLEEAITFLKTQDKSLSSS